MYFWTGEEMRHSQPDSETKALDKVLDESVNELPAIAEFMFD